MSNVWNLSGLRQRMMQSVKDGEREHQAVIAVLDACASIAHTLNHYDYHRSCALSALESVKAPLERMGIGGMLNSFRYDSQVPRALTKAQLVNQAHLVAAMHASRAVVDHYAQVENGVLRSPPLQSDRCDFLRLLKESERVGEGLSQRVHRVASSEAFIYVDAFVNVTKHRYLIAHGFGSDSIRYGMRVNSFPYKNKMHSGLWVEEVFEKADGLISLVMAAGALLNEFLGIDLPDNQTA